VKRPPEYFRAGAGAIIINGKGMVLALERAGIEGAWQLPQGGLKRGEEPFEAVCREVAEETGINKGDLELLGRAPEPLVYELPNEARSEKTGLGQVQYWFLFRFHGRDSCIDPEKGGEFRAWRWLPFSELIDLTVEFRRPVYRRLGGIFHEYLDGEHWKPEE
jgi:putative (di)nucleoside polyphosphate hydrolase